MGELNIKRKVSIYPNIHFETVIGTFIDKKKFEIIPINFTDHELVSSYSQNLVGEWCFPVKLLLALYEQHIKEKNVKDYFTLNMDICNYPFVFFKLHTLIKEKFNFYPIISKNPCMSFSIIRQSLTQLKKMDKSYSLFKFLKKSPIAFWKMNNIGLLLNIFHDNLPKVKNPSSYKRLFLKYKWDFILEEDYKKLKKIINKFEKISKDEYDEEKDNKKIHNVLISGDFSFLTIDFSLFDIDVFLAKNGIKVINNFKLADFCIIQKIKNYHKKAKILLKEMLSSKNLKINVNKHKLIEFYTLSSIINSLDKNISGIIFIKPYMCAPSERVSHILKEKKYFNWPYVEITYDEHSGLNGIITRLEAFINILKEKNN